MEREKFPDFPQQSEAHGLLADEEEAAAAAAAAVTDKVSAPRVSRALSRKVIALAAFILVILLNAVVAITATALHYHPWRATQPACVNPTVRREWRTLSDADKDAYISAVQCLTTRPSRFRPAGNGSLYDDIPWVHATVAHTTHKSPSFIVWHRYFLYVYERLLRDECGYSGHLAYWDWTRDHADLRAAPVWDAAHGFGGDGDEESPLTISHGRCVADGPFAGQRVLFNRTAYEPHCLSRGFAAGEDGVVAVPGLSPAKIEEVLAQPSFDSFRTGLERGPHKEIPETVRGDFFGFSAPYDPVFALHHGQLDRLWWLWQQREPETRNAAYEGQEKREHGLGREVQVDDLLRLHGLAIDMKVKDVLSTTGGLLCYRYE